MEKRKEFLLKIALKILFIILTGVTLFKKFFFQNLYATSLTNPLMHLKNLIDNDAGTNHLYEDLMSNMLEERGFDSIKEDATSYSYRLASEPKHAFMMGVDGTRYDSGDYGKTHLIGIGDVMPQVGGSCVINALNNVLWFTILNIIFLNRSIPLRLDFLNLGVVPYSEFMAKTNLGVDIRLVYVFVLHYVHYKYYTLKPSSVLGYFHVSGDIADYAKNGNFKNFLNHYFGVIFRGNFNSIPEDFIEQLAVEAHLTPDERTTEAGLIKLTEHALSKIKEDVGLGDKINMAEDVPQLLGLIPLNSSGDFRDPTDNSKANKNAIAAILHAYIDNYRRAIAIEDSKQHDILALISLHHLWSRQFLDSLSYINHQPYNPGFSYGFRMNYDGKINAYDTENFSYNSSDIPNGFSILCSGKYGFSHSSKWSTQMEFILSYSQNKNTFLDSKFGLANFIFGTDYKMFYDANSSSNLNISLLFNVKINNWDSVAINRDYTVNFNSENIIIALQDYHCFNLESISSISWLLSAIDINSTLAYGNYGLRNINVSLDNYKIDGIRQNTIFFALDLGIRRRFYFMNHLSLELFLGTGYIQYFDKFLGFDQNNQEREDGIWFQKNKIRLSHVNLPHVLGYVDDRSPIGSKYDPIHILLKTGFSLTVWKKFQIEFVANINPFDSKTFALGFAFAVDW